jgi:UDP-N-acetylglucosamine--N-acetylmuramyl-(pentapeptide) pyrophosphoryl-undecaprenol N-acetylglucosamine transferase
MNPEDTNLDDDCEVDTNRPLKIAFAGGGTGGHLFPGIAIAQEFMTRNAATRIIFISTGKPLEKGVLSKTNFELHCIPIAGIKGQGIWKQAKSISKIPVGIWKAMRILRRFSPDLTIGLGSYSAGPVVIAAWLLRIPIAVHEQNVLPGITNKILCRFADRIYISFEDTALHTDLKKIRWTGNPVRREIIEGADFKDRTNGNAGGRGPFTILVIGGSQGAHRINIAVVEALDHLKHRERMLFIHQTGEADEQMVRQAYQRSAVSFTVQSFFDNMPDQYRKADLIICRAGATTVAEITTLGKAVIFIPYPFAADNHQMLNATSLKNENAADMIIEKDLSGRILSQKIEQYMSDATVLNAMARRAKQFGKPHAAKDIVDDCHALLAA